MNITRTPDEHPKRPGARWRGPPVPAHPPLRRARSRGAWTCWPRPWTLAAALPLSDASSPPPILSTAPSKAFTHYSGLESSRTLSALRSLRGHPLLYVGVFRILLEGQNGVQLHRWSVYTPTPYKDAVEGTAVPVLVDCNGIDIVRRT